MDLLAFNTKHLPEKSFLLSFLIHFLLFNTFIFILPILPQEHKPWLVFLGPILQSSDITMSTIPLPQNKVYPTNNFIFSQKKSDIFEASIKKPTPFRNSLPENKKTLKSIYIKKEALSKNFPSTSKGNEIDLSIEPYRPLKLNNNDKN